MTQIAKIIFGNKLHTKPTEHHHQINIHEKFQ